MKAILIGMLLASPPVAAWILRGAESDLHPFDFQTVAEPKSPAPVRIPVEVVTKGSASQWIYVEVPSHQAVPEPSTLLLLPFASLLLLRRQRNAAN